MQILDSFPETKPEKGLSLVDLVKLKPDNQQNMVRLSVNFLIKRLMNIQEKIWETYAMDRLIKLYQIIYGTKEVCFLPHPPKAEDRSKCSLTHLQFVETGTKPNISAIPLPVKTTVSLAGLEKRLVENKLGARGLTLNIPRSSPESVSLLSPRGVEHQHISEVRELSLSTYKEILIFPF